MLEHSENDDFYYIRHFVLKKPIKEETFEKENLKQRRLSVLSVGEVSGARPLLMKGQFDGEGKKFGLLHHRGSDEHSNNSSRSASPGRSSSRSEMEELSDLESAKGTECTWSHLKKTDFYKQTILVGTFKVG